MGALLGGATGCVAGETVEHHLFVRIPFHGLGRVHREMVGQGLLLLDTNLYRGYLGVLRDVSLTPSSERQSK